MDVLTEQGSQTLFTELSAWNRQEEAFSPLFSPNSLKDREFLKMKLDTYDQLYYHYRNNINTPDEGAMLTMLRYQRKKLRRAVYPGLLRWVLFTITGSVIRFLRERKQKSLRTRGQVLQNIVKDSSTRIAIPPQQQGNAQDIRVSIQPQDSRQQNRQTFRPTLTSKRRNKQGLRL